MFKLMGKKIIKILHKKNLLNRPYDKYWCNAIESTCTAVYAIAVTYISAQVKINIIIEHKIVNIFLPISFNMFLGVHRKRTHNICFG